ncbi:2-nitropropane dioxygenase [Exidia glandulosa HHB12029]|uniref:2-nitropropane dioxygenase n=1 Tax=Exidia glandulosa HHB12029 TaxID=1314781 RepID=A0A166BQH9_EXIGL|nr:2-nitropropane dioxygenase [Exidia glandulosa HHB12029]
MAIVTELTRALGIRIPAVQGGMMWVGMPKLAAAVSEAGGLGILTALSQGSPEDLRTAIRKTRTLTSKPFGVNLTFLPTMSPPPYDQYAKVIVDEKVPVCETAGGPAAAPIIQMLRKHGVYVIHKCTSVRHAKTAVRLGANMLSIDGFECAGHPGEDDIGGVVLLARAAQDLKVPFIASGGFANGRGLASALALGAAGVNMGTAFMVVDEAEIHDNVKDTMIRSTERDTIHIFRTLHNTARVYKNKVAEEVVALERRPGGCEFKDIAHIISCSTLPDFCTQTVSCPPRDH